MILHTRRWGFQRDSTVVCLHGAAQHGGIWEPLARKLTAAEHLVVAPDLRGHGKSGRLPPWDTQTQVEDVIETLDGAGIGRAKFVGHSFGGLVAAALAASAPERVERLALLDPGLGLPPEQALTYAEIDRLDWSFSTTEGAVNALLSSDRIAAAPRETVEAFVKDDLRRGPDGLLHFGFLHSTAVVIWNEATRPPPPIAEVRTLLVRPAASFIDGRAQDRRYRDALGSKLTVSVVPNGHNSLWEAPKETEAAIINFLSP